MSADHLGSLVIFAAVALFCLHALVTRGGSDV